MNAHVLYKYSLEDLPMMRQPRRQSCFFAEFSIFIGFAILFPVCFRSKLNLP